MYLLLNRFGDFPASHITFHGCTIPPPTKHFYLLWRCWEKVPKHLLPNGGVFHDDFTMVESTKITNTRSFCPKIQLFSPPSSLNTKRRHDNFKTPTIDAEHLHIPSIIGSPTDNGPRRSHNAPVFVGGIVPGANLKTFVEMCLCVLKHHFQVDFFLGILFIKIAFKKHKKTPFNDGCIIESENLAKPRMFWKTSGEQWKKKRALVV